MLLVERNKLSIGAVHTSQPHYHTHSEVPWQKRLCKYERHSITTGFHLILKKKLFLTADYYALISWDTGLKIKIQQQQQTLITTKNNTGLALQQCFSTTNDDTSKKPPLAAKCAALCLSRSNRLTLTPLSSRPRTSSRTPSLAASIKAVRPVACNVAREQFRMFCMVIQVGTIWCDFCKVA